MKKGIRVSRAFPEAFGFSGKDNQVLASMP